MSPGERLRHVAQGEYAVTGDRGLVLTTILGSCVSACIRDPVAMVGGMNHFLLPGDARTPGDSLRYGVNAMELLINALLDRGAIRSRLEAKLFGGACVIEGISTDVGARNARFAARFLQAEGIAVVGQSLGGAHGRRIRYWPLTGRAALQLVASAEAPAPALPSLRATAVELF